MTLANELKLGRGIQSLHQPHEGCLLRTLQWDRWIDDDLRALIDIIRRVDDDIFDRCLRLLDYWRWRGCGRQFAVCRRIKLEELAVSHYLLFAGISPKNSFIRLP